jgi:ABC-2 type transport system permease protein
VQEHAPQQIPLFAFSIQSIHIEHHWLAEEAWYPGDRTVRNIAHQDDVGVGETHVQCRDECMKNGIEVLAGNTGQDHTPYSWLDDIISSRKSRAAIDTHIMSASRKTRRKLVGERFESAVAGRNTSCAKNRNFHQVRPAFLDGTGVPRAASLHLTVGEVWSPVYPGVSSENATRVAGGPAIIGKSAMQDLIREIIQYRELIWALALKELRVRYKRSALGFLWSLLNPLLMMIILAVVFSTITRIAVDRYSVFLISALLPWTFLSQSLAYSAESITTNGELLKKIYLPKSVFPMAAVVSNIINFLLSLIPLVFLLIVLRFPLHLTWLYLPVPLIALVMFALGCSFLVAAANVFFRDVAHIIQIVLSAWFYLSPIIYSIDFVPEKYRFYFRLNPMLYILNGFRDAIYGGHIPSRFSIAISLGSGVVALLIGYAYFRRTQDSFVYYV